ncbi:MAG: winged helix-turn-helix domain-containing protein, partial [Nitrospira sp.]|nr:winged helix-turn-helix domain-containing protein [Nitrospira sp.]
ELQDGVETRGQLLISNRPSFQELANMVGCSRETLSRTLKALKENGSLRVTRNTIYINRLWE